MERYVRPLVYDLEEADGYNVGIIDHNEQIAYSKSLYKVPKDKGQLESLIHLEYYVLSQQEPVPLINTEEIQRRLLKARITGNNPNPLLIQAIDGEKSIEESLNELTYVNKGLQKYLPRKKDPEHNRKLRLMGELIASDYSLEPFKQNGALRLDNFVNGALCGTIFGGAVFLAAAGVSYALLEPESSNQLRITAGAIVGSIMGLLAGGLIAQAKSNRNDYKEGNLEEKARYLDQKIEELS